MKAENVSGSGGATVVIQYFSVNVKLFSHRILIYFFTQIRYSQPIFIVIFYLNCFKFPILTV